MGEDVPVNRQYTLLMADSQEVREHCSALEPLVNCFLILSSCWIIMDANGLHPIIIGTKEMGHSIERIENTSQKVTIS